MSPHHYILNEKGQPVIEPDLFKWAHWMQDSERHVGDEEIGPYRISTVFLGLDHNFSNKGGPVFWETMVFKRGDGDGTDHYMDRCGGSREQAEAMHQRMIKKIEEVEEEIKRKKPVKKKKATR